MDPRRIKLLLGAVAISSLLLPLLYGMSSRTPLLLCLGFVAIAFPQSRISQFPLTFAPFSLSAGAFLITYIADGSRFDRAWADVNSLVLGSVVGWMAVAATETHEEWEFFQRVLMRGILATAASGAVLGLLKLAMASRGVFFEAFYDAGGKYIQGSSTSPEYNSYSYGIAAGLASAFWIRKRDPSILITLLAEASIPILAIAISFTGSRRAWLFILVGVLALLTALFVRENGKESPRPGASVRRGHLHWFLYAGGAGVLMATMDRWLPTLRDLAESTTVAGVIGRSVTLFSVDGSRTRLPYFQLGIDMFMDRSLLRMLFGSGFGYLTDFGAAFGGGGEDYPHNFVLSALLYGGIAQAVLLLFWLARTLGILWNAVPRNGPMLYLWTVSFLFASISSNSYFSMPLMIIFNLIAAHPLMLVGPKNQDSSPTFEPAERTA